jgi:hypothetical protein
MLSESEFMLSFAPSLAFAYKLETKKNKNN